MVNDSFTVVAVAFPGDVEEGGVDDQLVELACLLDHAGQLEVVIGATGGDVGGFAEHVLAVDRTTYKAV